MDHNQESSQNSNSGGRGGGELEGLSLLRYYSEEPLGGYYNTAISKGKFQGSMGPLVPLISDPLIKYSTVLFCRKKSTLRLGAGQMAIVWPEIHQCLVSSQLSRRYPCKVLDTMGMKSMKELTKSMKNGSECGKRGCVTFP